MTTTTEIITAAYREANLIPVGASPTTAEQAEALPRLQNLVSSVLGEDAGEELAPVSLGRNNVQTPQAFNLDDWAYDWVPPNIRVMANLQSAKTLNLPPNPQDGARFGVVDVSGNFSTYNLTLNGNGRQIEASSSLTLSADGYAGEWFYREDLGNWALVSPLTLGGAMPFPAKFDDLFIIGLELRLVSRNSQSISAESAARYDDQSRQFKAKYKQRVPTSADPATLCLSKQAFGPGTSQSVYGQPTAAFNAGWPFFGRRGW